MKINTGVNNINLKTFTSPNLGYNHFLLIDIKEFWTSILKG